MTRPNPSLRTQFIVSLLVAAALVVALVVFVENNQNDPNENKLNPSAIAEQNREADIVIAQEQRPHVLGLAHRIRSATGPAASAALTGAVTAFMDRQIALGTIAGSIQRVTCVAGRTRGSRAWHADYGCAAYASSVRYPFTGVVDTRRRELVYCRMELPPVPGEQIPLSKRCF